MAKSISAILKGMKPAKFKTSKASTPSGVKAGLSSMRPVKMINKKFSAKKIKFPKIKGM